jgi:hypothetical protein
MTKPKTIDPNRLLEGIVNYAYKNLTPEKIFSNEDENNSVKTIIKNTYSCINRGIEIKLVATWQQMKIKSNNNREVREFDQIEINKFDNSTKIGRVYAYKDRAGFIETGQMVNNYFEQPWQLSIDSSLEVLNEAVKLYKD